MQNSLTKQSNEGRSISFVKRIQIELFPRQTFHMLTCDLKFSKIQKYTELFEFTSANPSHL